ncbi:HAMP domain-containing sensor histidine kinase [Corynebacterium breve]|uniref:histidine kinase n=1 Tax=Corynebacterium breve TaxID=3049799 RepID=A0ABY8VEE5_9CORY|nr:HAMP domain-containing sensor histidine kinase [Corynebacterium breve]WIM67326.1 HAMP domain-containing sensor histidine kinase [Corynebacterium breve]
MADKGTDEVAADITDGAAKKGKSKLSTPPSRALPMRTWLVVLTVMISAFGLVGSSVAVHVLMREVLFSRVDEDLAMGIDTWARSVQLNRGSSVTPMPSEFCQITISPTGSIRTVNDQGSPPDFHQITELGTPVTIESTANSLEERDWRAIAIQGDDGTTTIVARSLEPEQQLMAGLGAIQAIIAAIVLILMGLASYYFVRRAMAPLREVESTALAIAEGDLDRRVPEWSRETEVGQLSYVLNKMLGELQDSLEEAQSKEEQMRRFVGDASHELRTPLTSLRGYTELYRQGATDDVDFVLTKIDDESKRMKLLVEDLLALTRAEGTRLSMKPVDLLELTLSVASSARAAFPGRAIEVDNSTAAIPVVSGDADRLHQVLLNLVVNGLKHGGEEATVHIELRYDEDNVIVVVADDGEGMSPEAAQHIFERFYRADTSRSRGSGGSGLGLAITKTLVEQHGGTISVVSEVGVGSVFTIVLPRLKEAELPSQADDE